MAAVGSVDAMGAAAWLGARVPGNDPRDLVDVALFGYELPPDGVPEPPAATGAPDSCTAVGCAWCQ